MGSEKHPRVSHFDSCILYMYDQNKVELVVEAAGYLTENPTRAYNPLCREGLQCGKGDPEGAEEVVNSTWIG